MRSFFGSPIVSRILGAAGAGATTWIGTGDRKAAVLTALAFLVYGAGHKTTEAAANK